MFLPSDYVIGKATLFDRIHVYILDHFPIKIPLLLHRDKSLTQLPIERRILNRIKIEIFERNNILTFISDRLNTDNLTLAYAIY